MPIVKSYGRLILSVVLLMGVCISGAWPVPEPSIHAASQMNTDLDIPHVVINEIAWGGTAANINHEWIELYNNTPNAISLTGWRLYAADGSPDITLDGTIGAYAYYLIERSTDDVVSDIPADLVAGFGLGLSNTGEILNLIDNTEILIDAVNPDGGPWGNSEFGATPYFQSLERKRPALPGTDDNWLSNDGTHNINGLDANSSPIMGTPHSINAATLQSPTQFVDLSIDIGAPASIDAGDLITYSLDLRYTGTVTATNVSVKIEFPSDLVFVSQPSDYPVTLLGDHLSWVLGDLGPDIGAHEVITATFLHDTVTSMTLSVTATIESTVNDDTPENNLDTSVTDVLLPQLSSNAMKISALLYDGYQPLDVDDAIQIANTSGSPAILRNWQICKDDSDSTTCRALPDLFIAAHDVIWLTRDANAFTRSFGHTPDYEVPTLPSFPNTTGCGIRLLDETNATIDTVVYGEFYRAITGWEGATLEPYSVLPRSTEGQILSRRRDEQSNLLTPDTDTAVDWMQYTNDLWYGRQFLYPGWNYKELNTPTKITTTATIRAGIAPDNAYALISEMLSDSETSIDISMYTFTHPALINLLVQKAQQGVAVRLLLEGAPVALDTESVEWQTELRACAMLEQAGGECWFMIHDPDASINNRYTYLHAKYIIIDNTWLVISTQNFEYDSLPSDPKDNGTKGSRGYVVATDAVALVQHAATVFGYDLDPENHNDMLRWNTGYLERYGSCDPALINLETPDFISYTVRFDIPLITTTPASFEIFTAPEGALRTSDALLGMINQAGYGDRLYVEQAYEHAVWGEQPNLRLHAYIEAARRGAQVRILLNGHGYTTNQSIPPAENQETLSFLGNLAQTEDLDLQVSLGNPAYDGIHSKLVLVALQDGQRIVHISSINGSEASSKINREMAVQIASPELFDYVYSAFSVDWWSSIAVYLPLTVRNADSNFNRVTHALISEVAYNQDANHEWIELYNPTSQSIDIGGYHVGDASSREDFEAMFIFPVGTMLGAHDTLIVAVNGAVMTKADYEFYENSISVPNMIPDHTWGNLSYPFALRNEGDEIILMDAGYEPVDIIVYGTGTYPGIIPHPGVQLIGASLERFPADEDTDNCAEDFRERYPPTPGEMP